jgi:predicted RNA-binding Zn-ribbon protein involved in translation (DUF1610 family)
MGIFFWFSGGGKKEHETLGEGFFNCPECKRRQPGEVSQTVARDSINSIPLGTGEAVGAERYTCRVCGFQGINDGGYAYDFGPHAEVRAWNCFKCRKPVPYERFDCPHCGYEFKSG